MTSKTFKSAEPDNRELEIDYIFGMPRLLVKDFDGDNKGFIFNTADAASLMLAIGDALPAPEMVLDGSYEHFMATAIHYLAQAVKAQESRAAEARERAELEAEALELLNAHREATGNPFAESLDGLLYNAKENWLAVARRAREMRAEK